MSAVLDRLRGSAARPPRKALPAFFGLHTRYILQVYLQHIFVVLAGLLIAALTIDISTQLRELLAAEPAAAGLDIPLRLAWYSLLRGADIGTRLLPIGCFFGVLSAEVAMTSGRERLMISNTGRSPYQCVVPVVLLGIVFGCLQVTLDSYLRPLAMKAQISGQLGEDGRGSARTMNRQQRWFASKAGLVNARIEYGPPPVLHDLTVFSMSSDGQLSKVLIAESATPQPNSEYWLLQNGRFWAKEGALPGAGVDVSSLAGKATAYLGIDPLWVSYLDISPVYFSQTVLKSLRDSGSSVYDPNIYRMIVQIRYANWLLPGSMIFLASSMSLFFLRRGVSFGRVVAMALVGYSIHVALRALSLLGGHGYLAPDLVAWFVPCLLLLATAVILAMAQFLGTGGRLFRGIRGSPDKLMDVR